MEEDESEGALVVPYPPDLRDGRTNRGFSDLRGKPELARQIAEANGSPAMQDFLESLAQPDSQFISIGCELGTRPHVPDQPHEAGGYIHLTFADLNDRALDNRCQQRLGMGLRMLLQTQAADSHWVVEFIPSVIGAAALNGPDQVWSPIIYFYAFSESADEAAASRETLIRTMTAYFANPTY